jgi:hypothetical protein
VVVRDLIRRSDHAVLGVRSGGRLWVLDNGSDGSRTVPTSATIARSLPTPRPALDPWLSAHVEPPLASPQRPYRQQPSRPCVRRVLRRPNRSSQSLPRTSRPVCSAEPQRSVRASLLALSTASEIAQDRLAAGDDLRVGHHAGVIGRRRPAVVRKLRSVSMMTLK